MSRIQSQFLSILKSEGLEEIRPTKGATLDHVLHEPVSVVDVKEREEDNRIHDVLQSGYSLGGRVIRPAKVRIGHFAASQ